jgi:hypothetical protein
LSDADGTVGATVKVVDNGHESICWDLVVLGDGYRRTELSRFHDDVERFCDEVLKATAPFDELWRAINVHRVDVTSTDSGADNPCMGARPVRTFFDAIYCDPAWGGVEHLLTVNEALAMEVATASLQEWSAVLVNAEDYGGSGAPLVAVSAQGSLEQTAIHELGHSAFGLADEYDSSVPGSLAGGEEPDQPNVTRDTNRSTNKWRDLIEPPTPMPTSCNRGCPRCRRPLPTPPPDRVGAYEGALHQRCGLYRPFPNCYMRTSQEFCPVCTRVIRLVLESNLP